MAAALCGYCAARFRLLGLPCVPHMAEPRLQAAHCEQHRSHSGTSAVQESSSAACPVLGAPQVRATGSDTT